MCGTERFVIDVGTALTAQQAVDQAGHPFLIAAITFRYLIFLIRLMEKIEVR